jgi:transposase
LRAGERLEPRIHQVVEIPPIVPDVTEYILGRRRCPYCNTVTSAPLPQGVPPGICGPRLSALTAYLTGYCKVSRRKALELIGDLLHVQFSLGTVSNVEANITDALEAPHREALACVQRARVKHLDATSWSRSGVSSSLWTFASRLATVFVITANATAQTVQALVGRVRGTLVTDRAAQFGFWAMEQRQICWAHLTRRFVAFSECADPAVQSLGNALLLLTEAHLEEWHRFQAGLQTREGLQKMIGRIEPLILHHLEQGRNLGRRGVSGSCEDILDHQEALFTYAFKPGVPPTNNHAERELRAPVMWRKQTAGTRSERGDRFAERIMTVVHTLRKQGRHVLSYLEQAYVAALRGKPCPSLMPNGP